MRQTCTCPCCQGPSVLTPATTANRFGLSQLSYRVGTHGTFYQTMQARLSNPPSMAGDDPVFMTALQQTLLALRNRERSDTSLALLDAWATVGDVLSFYQERIANEGYLRTATERRSVLELARLIGYALRTGVAASVYLAYTIENNCAQVEIPKGARCNSIPEPGEEMQTFETAEPLSANFKWNTLKPRLTQPQSEKTVESGDFYLKGTATGLKANAPLLVMKRFRRVQRVDVDAANNRTHVILQDANPSSSGNGRLGVLDAVKTLNLAPSLPPASAKQLPRNAQVVFGEKADTFARLLTTLQPMVGSDFYTAWKNLTPPAAQPEVYALRISAAPFGHNAPLRLASFNLDRHVPTFDEWKIDEPWSQEGADEQAVHHEPSKLFLDNDYDIAPGSWVVIEPPGNKEPISFQAQSGGIAHRSLAAYGLSGKTVQITTRPQWLNINENGNAYEPFSTIRNTRVFTGSERLELAEEPISASVASNEIELDDIYQDLQPGRWLIVSGERADIKDTDANPVPGIKAAELVMLAAVEQRSRMNNEGDPIHSFITLAKPLAYAYKRETVVIYGNVVKATQGESRQEILGSGDATKSLQAFTLRQPPLTYVSATTGTGVKSTLQVRVNEIQWHNTDSLAVMGPADRQFITRTDDDGNTTVVFGNGEHGARLPTGQENIQASYRNGIGKSGNVHAGQISLLGTRPLGVKAVTNPIRASGGADKESRDQARRNAPLAVLALDRLVATQDYSDFTRSFAGIGKASAVRVSDGHRQTVQVTIAGVDDAPIETSSDLYRNLYKALQCFGDPSLAVGLLVRERLALVVVAKVGIDPDYQWDSLEPKIRAAMLNAFGFDNVDLGEDLLLADAIKVMQRVPGVKYVNVEGFDTLSQEQLLAHFRPTSGLAVNQTKPAALQLARKDRIVTGAGSSQGLPTKLAYLDAAVPDTLILQEHKS